MKKQKKDPEYEVKWTFCERLPSFFLINYRKGRWISSLIGSDIRMLHNRARDDHGVSRKVQSLRHVPRSSTSRTPCDMLQGQILHKFQVARVKTCRRTREDVSLQHVSETRPGNFFTSVPTLRFGRKFVKYFVFI